MMIYNYFNIKRRNITPIVSRIIFVACLMFYGLSSSAQPQMLIVIANPKGAPNALKFSELKSVMLGEKQQWKSRTKVSVAIMKPNTQLGKNTARTIYNMTANELMQSFLSMSNQGLNTHPKLCKTTAEIIEFVTENPGAIGIIDQPIDNSAVKTVTIDGKTQISVLLLLMINSGMPSLACL